MNEYVHTLSYNNVCTQVRTTVYGRGRGLRGPVGVGWCATNTTYTPTLLGSEGSAGAVLSDLGGGVNSHDVNLRDKCGVCDDVTG